MNQANRRNFLKTAAMGGTLAGLGDLAFLSRLSPVSAAETQLPAPTVQLEAGLEPVVRLIEETPRDQLLEQVGARIRNGDWSYRDVLGGLLLAGVRNVEPRPSVGFKFHSVLVVNSAHLAAQSSPASQRWLPIFWSLDYFKEAAAKDVAERGDWRMAPIDDGALPRPSQAHQAFTAAMDDWNDGAADVAIASLARSAGVNEIYEMFFRYGARDFRSIGHKAIYVANSYRTLQCLGWKNAEPVLRSLAYALLMHEDSNPRTRDDEADRPYRRNLELAQKIQGGWRDGKLDDAATSEMLQTLRTGSNDEACDLVVEQLNRGVSPQSVWDALHVGAGELLMRQPGIVGLHAVTTTNALHFAYQTSGNDETRRLMMLQNAAFLPMFRGAMQSRGKVLDLNVQELEAAKVDGDSGKAVEQIFAEVSSDPTAAARSTLGYLQQGNSAKEYIDAARLMVFLKGNDAHDYKFSSAALEDYFKLSPNWRNLYMASSVFKLNGSGQRDNGLVQRTRNALA
ncbi:twin-arginine translocation signal domain-containing protein [Lignipirellula cremea]|uniref:Twin-arginine translocation signal domain-containing protein n=1 Tax=Lignipirellula cremea TaxID=2528010 RepID=A0A518DXS6_9BACT|nr:twin-arginine translocation signal domain-containing protein [Lignipirellula cremea]QDU96644.1 hypothetical protein Pla8534_44650 [Lignipirellula cremea]